MRVATVANPRDVIVADAAVPRPGAGEVLIRIAGCGICGSNLPVWQGRPWFHYPLPPGAPGHEPWGTVTATGDGVSGLGAGTAVAFLCERAFAEWAIVPATDVVALPPAIADDPVPGEALACAANVIARCGIQPGERVAVVGVGFLGAVLIALARAAGADVAAWSRRPFAREVAERMGATGTYAIGADGAAEIPPRELPFDCVIEAAGEQRTLDLASSLVRERGRLVIAGYHQDGARQVDMQSWNWRGIDVINAHERDRAIYVRGLRSAVAALAAGQLDPRDLYTHVFPLDDLNAAFRTATERPHGFLKALVVM